MSAFCLHVCDALVLVFPCSVQIISHVHMCDRKSVCWRWIRQWSSHCRWPCTSCVSALHLHSPRPVWPSLLHLSPWCPPLPLPLPQRLGAPPVMLGLWKVTADRRERTRREVLETPHHRNCVWHQAMMSGLMMRLMERTPHLPGIVKVPLFTA